MTTDQFKEQMAATLASYPALPSSAAMAMDAIIDAYVAEKDGEIKRKTIANEQLMETSKRMLAAKDAEIDRLQKVTGVERTRLGEYITESRKERDALNAEIKRLREGIESHVKAMDSRHFTTWDNDAWYFADTIDRDVNKLKTLLSPADNSQCNCSYTFDGKLASQCDACRNKPITHPADTNRLEDVLEDSGDGDWKIEGGMGG